MTKYIKEYIAMIKKALESGAADRELREEMLRHIAFIQHERLIHFLVTMLFVIIFFIALALTVIVKSPVFAVLSALLLALIIPYIGHYYFLENSTQELYRLYDELVKKDENGN